MPLLKQHLVHADGAHASRLRFFWPYSTTQATRRQTISQLVSKIDDTSRQLGRQAQRAGKTT